MSSKSPSYTITNEADGVQIRAYSPYIEARVSVGGCTYQQAANQGFRILADYIFGNNKGSKSIEMTAPVAVQQQSSSNQRTGQKIAMMAPVKIAEDTANLSAGTFIVSFVMPLEFTLQTLPEAVNRSINFQESKGKTFAAYRFGGLINEANIKKAKHKLLAWLKDQDYKTLGEPMIAAYNGPFTPWFLARNEIMQEIEL
jgi:hypothetical protein